MEKRIEDKLTPDKIEQLEQVVQRSLVEMRKYEVGSDNWCRYQADFMNASILLELYSPDSSHYRQKAREFGVRDKFGIDESPSVDRCKYGDEQ